MFLKKAAFLILALGILILTGCKKDEDPSPLVIPANYDGSAYAVNSQPEQAIAGVLESLTSTMASGRSGANVDVNALNGIYSSGSPSLRDITTPYFADKITRAGGWFEQLANSSGNTYDPNAAPGGPGGVYGPYLFDGYGLETMQRIEKGLFLAALYNRATTILNSNMSAADVDRLVTLFGANPDFPNSDNGANVANPDRFLAKYAARRDKNDGNGLYTRMKNDFIKLQAALKAGDDYAAERDQAIQGLRENWEKSSAATAINYLQGAASRFALTSPTPSDLSTALHAYAEGVGFLHGWKNIDANYRVITNQQIDDILTKILAPADGNPSSYQFVTDPFNQVPKLTSAADDLKAIYGFTDQEMEDFKKNWVNEQGR